MAAALACPLPAAALDPDAIDACHQAILKGQAAVSRGRIAVVEFLAVNPAIRKAISRRENLDDPRDLARSAGLISLRDSCLRLARDGVIPLPEILDVLTAEQMREG